FGPAFDLAGGARERHGKLGVGLDALPCNHAGIDMGCSFLECSAVRALSRNSYGNCVGGVVRRLQPAQLSSAWRGPIHPTARIDSHAATRSIFVFSYSVDLAPVSCFGATQPMWIFAVATTAGALFYLYYFYWIAFFAGASLPNCSHDNQEVGLCKN